jgi:MFS family permease
LSGRRLGFGEAFSSLKSRNYKLYFYGQLVSLSGTWMQTIAQSFLVLQLTDSGTTLGLTLAARFAPLFLFGPWGGLIADRLDKRRVMYVTQAASGLLAAAFGVLISTHIIALWMVYLLATALGFVNVFDNPARQAFISELVPKEQLRNAVTLNSVTANVARILGAALGGGVAASLGLATCFDLNAVSFLAVVITLALMTSQKLEPSTPEPRERGQVRAGLRYVGARQDLLIPLLMVAIVGMLAWEFQVSLPLVAKQTFHGGAGCYAIMTSMMGVGAIVGGLVAASRSAVSLRTLAVTAIAWGISICAAGLAPDLAAEYVALTFVGYGSITFNSLAKTVLQLGAAPRMRGRVMALWALAWQGSTPIGGPIIGWISQTFGARWGLLAGGLPTLAAGVLAYAVLGRLDEQRRTEEMQLDVAQSGQPETNEGSGGVG